MQHSGTVPARSGVGSSPVLPRLTRCLRPAGYIAVYSVIAVAAYWPTSPVSSHLIMKCGCEDAAQEAWFLAWPLYAFVHFHNIAYTDWIGFPSGVNLMANTSMPLLGALSSPVTAAAGPVAAYNLLLRLGFATSATSMFFVLRHWRVWSPAAFIGGLVYGFSPYLVGEGLGHVFLVFAPLPPLIFLMVSKLFAGERRSTWKVGLALGALAAAQFYISAELLVTTALLSGVAVLLVLLADRPGAGARIRGAWAGLACAAAVFAVLTGYAIWFFLYGTQHISGPSHSVAELNPYRADLLSAIIPTHSELLAPFNLAVVGDRLVGQDTTETGAYIGIPLLILLATIVVRFRHDPRVRLGSAMALVSYVLSMGSDLRVDGASTGIPLPFALLQRVPIIQGADAGRFSLYTSLFIAVVLAVGLGHLRELPAATRGNARGLRWTALGSRIPSRWRSPRWRPVTCLAVTALCLVPLVPDFPYSEVPDRVPRFFTSADVDRVPSASVVLAYPYPYTPNDQAMLWSAVAGMRFRIIGGQAAIPGPGGKTSSAPQQLAPTSVEELFLSMLSGTSAAAPAVPPLDAETEADIRQFLLRYWVKTIVVDPIGLHGAAISSYLTAALHSPPKRMGGVEVWFSADELARRA